MTTQCLTEKAFRVARTIFIGRIEIRDAGIESGLNYSDRRGLIERHAEVVATKTQDGNRQASYGPRLQDPLLC
jgi:hypothetical protein